MTLADAYKAILQRWISQAAIRMPTLPYAIDNRKLTSPTPPFAQVDILTLGGEQATMGAIGSRRFERSGFIDVRLFGARDRGRGEIDVLAQHTLEIFEALDISGLRTWTTTVREVREDREFPSLWCLLVRTPWEIHDRR